MIPAILIPYLLAVGSPGFDSLSGISQKGILGPYLVIGLVVFTCVFVSIKKILLIPISSAISSLPEIRDTDGLSPLLKRRLSKTAFFYLSGTVPKSFWRTRVSPVPNCDGTFWMMTTDADFSTLSFEKYRVGDIPEPTDPDASVKYSAAFDNDA